MHNGDAETYDADDVPYSNGITVNYWVLQRCRIMKNSLHVPKNV